MSNILSICEGEYYERAFRNPSAEMIDRAIDDLIPALYHFVILESNPPIEKYAYIQTLILRDGVAKGQYLVEARYIFGDSFKHYKKHAGGADEVKMIFRKYADGFAPNVVGWEDITGRMMAATG